METGPISNQILHLTEISLHQTFQLFLLDSTPPSPSQPVTALPSHLTLESFQCHLPARKPPNLFSFCSPMKWIKKRKERHKTGKGQWATSIFNLSKTCPFWLWVLFNPLLRIDCRAWNIHFVCCGLDGKAKKLEELFISTKMYLKSLFPLRTIPTGRLNQSHYPWCLWTKGEKGVDANLDWEPSAIQLHLI